MKIELHILQNFAPSNLNRDDTGSPKDCELGGYRRARISSQCQKRAVRQSFRLDGLVADQNLAARTKRLAQEVARQLIEKYQHEEGKAHVVAMGALEGVGLKRKGEDDAWKTQYLLFVPRRVVSVLADLLHEHWEELVALSPAIVEADPGEGVGAAEGKAAKKDAKKKDKDAKAAKKEAKANYPKDVQKKVEQLLEGAQGSVDLSLFGRMIADKPEWNVEASCQVAHAISTHKVQMDFDFFTAVDDFKPNDNAGSDMMGTIQFNSSCFYRYAVLDVDAFKKNLEQKNTEDEGALLKTAVNAFLRAFADAIPTGKQNSMAAHNPPSYLLAVVRKEGSPVSLTNAFLKPARPTGDDDLVDDSIKKLEGYLGRMDEFLEGATLLSWADRELKDVAGVVREPKLKGLFAKVVAEATGEG